MFNLQGTDNIKTGSTVGEQPEVKAGKLESDTRVIQSPDQAISVGYELIRETKKLIRNAARITNKKQGSRPYDPKVLENQQKGWKTNVSTGAFATELRRAAPRLYMPILTATTLTAAELPIGWPQGEEKTRFFRECVTETVRSWRKWEFFVRGLAQEVVDYGFTFACFTDPYEWRPHLVRMDRGFVPTGTEIMDENIPRFMLKWYYKPEELLELARKAIDAGVEGWNKEAVAQAVQGVTQQPARTIEEESRKFEELIREQPYDFVYKQGYRTVETWHLFVVEPSSKVSHYLLWPDGSEGNKMLMERPDAYESMTDVTIPVVFMYGNGTIHGSWGAGHLLYDIGNEVEKVRCDMIDNLRNANKTRLQVADAKDINSAKLTVNDTMIIASGATFAQNMGGVQQNTESYVTLDNNLTRFMQERIGAFLPPIPLQNSDIKAAQVNAALQQEAELKQDVLQMWLSQFAWVMHAITKRLLDKESDDEMAVRLRKHLKGEENWWAATKTKLTKVLEKLGIQLSNKIALSDDEIDLLVDQPVIKAVTDFTPYAAQQRAAFAAAVFQNPGLAPLFNQAQLARLIAEGVPGGGARLAEAVCISQDDPSQQTAQQWKQKVENTSMSQGQDMPVIPSDNHMVHVAELKPFVEAMIQTGATKQAGAGARHLAAHYAAGVATKTIPPDQVNALKSYVAKIEQAVQAAEEQKAKLEQMQAMQQQQGGGGPPAGFNVPPPPGVTGGQPLATPEPVQ